MTNLPTTTTKTTAVGFSNADSFELMQRVAQAFSGSDLVPETFKGKIGNCVIGVELAQRIGASPLMVMQNLNVIHGRPAFSSKFIISAINTCGKFSPLRFKIEQLGKKKVDYTYWVGQKPNRTQKTASVEINDIRCTALATELATGEILEGPAVTIEMAVQEGWYTKNDSKWKTMPDLMLRYRAASFFGNLYAPEILMGMATVEEVHDIIDVTPQPADAGTDTDSLNTIIKKRGRPAKQQEPAQPIIDAELTTDAESLAHNNPSMDNYEPASQQEINHQSPDVDNNQAESGDLW